jgi:hypothetical protein
MNWIETLNRHPEFDALSTFLIVLLDTSEGEEKKEVIAKLLKEGSTDREDLTAVLKQLRDLIDSPLPVEEKMAFLTASNLYCPDWPSTLSWLRKMERLLEETIQELE